MYDNNNKSVYKTRHVLTATLSQLKVTLTLTFNLLTPKTNRDHLLYMTNVCMKFKKAGPNQTLVIDRTRLYTTDRRTGQRTDRCITIYPLFSILSLSLCHPPSRELSSGFEASVWLRYCSRSY